MNQQQEDKPSGDLTPSVEALNTVSHDIQSLRDELRALRSELRAFRNVLESAPRNLPPHSEDMQSLLNAFSSEVRMLSNMFQSLMSKNTNEISELTDAVYALVDASVNDLTPTLPDPNVIDFSNLSREPFYHYNQVSARHEQARRRREQQYARRRPLDSI